MEEEADKLLEEKLDFIQACEKYYKISEEIVKALSEMFAPETMKKVTERIKKGDTPWTTRLLNIAVDEIVVNIKWTDTEQERIFRDGWRAAVTLHRDGFHEQELTYSDILNEVRKVKNLINLAKTVLKDYEDRFLKTTATRDAEIKSPEDFLRKIKEPRGESA